MTTVSMWMENRPLHCRDNPALFKLQANLLSETHDFISPPVADFPHLKAEKYILKMNYLVEIQMCPSVVIVCHLFFQLKSRTDQF